jgi:GNAT superfamily N-acetyltransferase
MAPAYSFRPGTPADLDALVSLGVETYRETFQGMTGSEVMDGYLAEAFDRTRIEGELRNTGSAFFFLDVHGIPAGYLKLNENGAQTDLRGPDGLEIAGQRGKRYGWLGVWEKNTAAIGFYRKLGFEKAGTRDFFVGQERQTDWIMKYALQRGE